MRVNTFVITAIILSIGLSSCTKESIKNAWSKQEKDIENYIASQLKANSAFYGISTSNLFATNREAIAKAAGWTLSDKDAFKIETINLREQSIAEGLRNGLIGVKGGEECIILFSGKYGFGNNNLGTIPANSALAWHIWVESISNE